MLNPVNGNIVQVPYPANHQGASSTPRVQPGSPVSVVDQRQAGNFLGRLGRSLSSPLQRIASFFRPIQTNEPIEYANEDVPTLPEANVIWITQVAPRNDFPQLHGELIDENDSMGLGMPVYGQGGAGSVYRIARSDGLFSAMKVARPDMEHCIETEITILARIQDVVGVPKIFEVGDDYFTMEWINGQNLHQWIKENPIIDGASSELPSALNYRNLTSFLHLIMQYTRILSYIQVQGIIHGDFKPKNLMVDEYGRTKVIDFGTSLEKNRQPRLSRNESPDGTPKYRSPEINRGGRKLDYSDDIYALGVTLYQGIFGTCPAEQLKDSSDALRIQLETHSVPEELAAIISKAMHPDRNKRYREVDEFYVDLYHALQFIELPRGIDASEYQN